ncbi:hypothetical protein LIT25_05460 [Bacillus sp. F19]|nr:hypothetical protein LIT25_05460 [Bacillus sp. F19]
MKCVKSEYAAQKRLPDWKEVRQIGVCSTKKDPHPKEVRQTGVSSTKKALSYEGSASNRNLQHNE